LAPIKGDEHPQPSPPLFPLSPELPHSFLLPRIELKSSPFFAPVAPPLRRRSCSGEQPSGTPSSGLSSSTATAEPYRPHAAKAPLRPLVRAASVHCGPEPRRPVHAPWTRSIKISIGK
jgi:hypothetical protein